MPTSDQHPDIVLIVLDTHRLDRLGCYGYARGTTPNIDAFAESATLFERAISPAQWTIPAHASLFTGEPPSTHVTTQSRDVLDPRHRTLAQRLSAVGYRTVGFCNNPLVGVINNGMRRGFAQFYNYCGAVQSTPKHIERLPDAMRTAWERYRKATRRIIDPVQNLFATSTEVFQAALNPLWVPLWTRFAHFKGDTPRSIRDAAQFVRREMAPRERAPVFAFLNLMEPHLPYSPAERYVERFAPQVQEEGFARDFVHAFNRQAMRWLIPLDRPFTELESNALSDVYDAEIAYQDHMLAELLGALDEPRHRDETAVIIVADHGEMLGEHRLMGHGFGVYEELVRVPMLVRLPGQTVGQRVPHLVSSQRLFHTVLDCAGQETYETAYGVTVDIACQSLRGESVAPATLDPTVFCEAYAPEFAVQIMERHRPGLAEEMHSRETNWAAYEGHLKLIRVEGRSDELYSLRDDSSEQNALAGDPYAEQRQYLGQQLDSFVEKAISCRLSSDTRAKVDLDDEAVRQRLRALGYID